MSAQVETIAPLNSHVGCHYLWLTWRLLGMQPLKQDNRFIYGLYALTVNICFAILYPLHHVVQIFIMHDFMRIVNGLIITISSVFSTFKQMIIFYHRQSKLKEVDEIMRHLDGRASADPEERALIEDAIRWCQRIFLAYFSTFMSSLVAYCLVGYMHGGLIFESWMPFDWHQSRKAYYLAFLYQFVCNSMQLMQNLSNDTYPVIYLLLLLAHFRALNKRIARLGNQPQLSKEENYCKLLACIEDHKVCLRCFNTMRPIISGTIFIQFVITGFVLSIIGVSYVHSNRNIEQLFKSVTFFLSVLGELLPCCWLLTALMHETNYITTALYHTLWYEQDARFRKTLIIFMEYSQKSVAILAGNLLPIGLPSFLAVIKFAFSVFTILNEMS